MYYTVSYRFPLAAQKGLDFFNALSVGGLQRFRTFQSNAPGILWHIFIIQLFQVIREPIIIDRKQTEERGLSGSLTAAYKTEHYL